MLQPEAKLRSARGRGQLQGISSIISQADVSLWLSSSSLSDPAVLLATVFCIVVGLVYMAKGLLTFGFTRRSSREDKVKEQTGELKASGITAADTRGIDEPRQSKSTGRSAGEANEGGGGRLPNNTSEAVQPAGQPQGQQKDTSKWASTVSTLSEKSVNRSLKQNNVDTQVREAEEKYGARDGVVGLDASASPVKSDSREHRQRPPTTTERRQDNLATLTHGYSLPEDDEWEEEGGEGDEEFRLFSEEEEAMLAAAGDTPGRTGDDSIEALLMLLIAVENEGQRIEAKMRRIKYGPELLGAVRSARGAVEEHKQTLQEALAHDKMVKETSGGELPPGKVDVDRVIREVRRVATGVQVVIEKVRVSRTLLFGRGRAFKHAFRDYQRRLMQSCAQLLASLCNTMASQAAGPEEDGAESVDARTKRLAADRLLHSSRGSRSRHAAFELYAWAAEHGSAPAMLSLARLCGGEEGKGGLDSDPAVQRFWMEKAALHGSREAMTELGVSLISEAIGSRLLLDLGDEGGSGQMVHAATMTLLEGDDKDAVLADVEAILNRLQGPKLETLVGTYRATSKRVSEQLQSPFLSTRRRPPDDNAPRTPRMDASVTPGNLSATTPSPFRHTGRKLAQTMAALQHTHKPADTQHFGATVGRGDTGRMAQTWGGEDKGSSNRHKLKRGLSLLVVAAQQGHAPAQATLGSIYRALGNREAALHWYGMGAQQEDANAQNNLGLLLLQGVEPQSEDASAVEEEAIRLFRAAVANGSRHACNNLGVCLERRSLSDRHNGRAASTRMVLREEACRAYKLGASRGCPQAMANLGYNLAREALVVLSSSAVANRRIHKHTTAEIVAAAASSGVFSADVSGAVGMLQEGVTWLRRGVEAGVIDSSYDLAVLYEQGALGFPADPVVAFNYYKHAADQAQGHPKAACRVGDMCYSGKGVGVDYELAVTYYEQAGRAGDAEALNALGIMLEEGKGLSRNTDLAQAFYSRAAELGHAHAAYNLGLLLWRHDPVRILTRLANKRAASSSLWPKDEAKATQQEEEEAQDTRTCTPEDLEASLAAFELAARLGHPQANKDAERVRVQMRHAYATTSLLNDAMAAAEQRNQQTGRSAYTNAAVKTSYSRTDSELSSSFATPY